MKQKAVRYLEPFRLDSRLWNVTDRRTDSLTAYAAFHYFARSKKTSTYMNVHLQTFTNGTDR